jgi:hypothetical protein
MSRKLLNLSVTQACSDVDSNPFIIKTKTTEGTLLTGECDRKISKLESMKYKLIQQQATGQTYLENLSRK